MNVRLLNYTPKPIETVYTAARACYSENEPSNIWSRRRTDLEMSRLIDQVISSGHLSVLEHLSFTFAIEGISRTASHQLVRHRMASFSQQSQRYASLLESDFITPPSVKFSPEAAEIFKEQIAQSADAYRRLIRMGIPKEDARFIMPNATATNIVMTMNFRELTYVAGLRLCQRAQWEIRKVFLNIKSELHSIPELSGFADYLGPRCENLGYCPEYKSCGYYPSKRDVISFEDE
jgi:thymidylate synthase (FAD)